MWYQCDIQIENREIEKLALTVQNLSVLNENEVERTAILLTLRSLTPWHGRHEKCPTHNYVPALWLITPLVCHFCVQKEKIEKKKKVFTTQTLYSEVSTCTNMV